MKPDLYLLNDAGEPVAVSDLFVWARGFGALKRQVAVDTVGGLRISTVFLGLDHNFGGGPPVLWETMVFKDGESVDMNRCAGSREQALAMHEAMVKKVGSGGASAQRDDAEHP